MSKKNAVITAVLLIPLILVGSVYYLFKHHSYFSQTVEGRLSESFVEYIQKTQKETHLQVAEIQQVETFQLDSKKVSASTNIKYFVDLKKTWALHTEDKKIVVLAPAIEFAVTSEPGISAAALSQRATQNMNSVLEAARKEVVSFFVTWLKSEFPKESEFDVKVDFQN